MRKSRQIRITVPLLLLIVLTVCAEAEAQTTIYWKRDTVYAGPGGGAIAIITPPSSDSTVPSAPTGLGVTSTTATSVALSWTGSSDSGGSGLAGYKVYRQKGSGASLPVGTVNSSTTAFTDQPLEPNTSYYYTIVAFDNAQNHSSASGSVNPTTSTSSGDATAPGAPPNLRGRATTRQSNYKVRLDWDAATDAGGSGIAGYKVYRDSTLISGSNPITARTYEDSTNTANTAYTYKVKAIDGASNASADSNAVTVTTLRQATLETFNSPDESGSNGLYIRNNTLQWVGPDPYCTWDPEQSLYDCRWDERYFSSASWFRASVRILSRGSFFLGIGIWQAGDAAYRAYVYQNYLYLEYWDTPNGWSATGLGFATVASGPGTLTVEADSTNRRIKVYWDGVLKIDFTETDTSRSNTGDASLGSWGGGYIAVPQSVFDDLLVEF